MNYFSTTRHFAEQLQLQITSLIQENQRLKQENTQLKQLVLLDPLTNIGNRRYFEQSLLQEFKDAVRLETPLGLLMLDLDRFKQYNDSYGHLEGDRLLRKTALALKEALERPKDMLFRYGGDEFVALLPNTNCFGVEQVGLKLLSAARICGGTISLGAVCADASLLKNSSELVALADRTMYRAKELGRDRLVLADESWGAS